jgi:curved DNA-binding protein CbpA
VRNPYEILGVASTASSADIQQAYRTLAREVLVMP